MSRTIKNIWIYISSFGIFNICVLNLIRNMIKFCLFCFWCVSICVCFCSTIFILFFFVKYHFSKSIQKKLNGRIVIVHNNVKIVIVSVRFFVQHFFFFSFLFLYTLFPQNTSLNIIILVLSFFEYYLFIFLLFCLVSCFKHNFLYLPKSLTFFIYSLNIRQNVFFVCNS